MILFAFLLSIQTSQAIVYKKAKNLEFNNVVIEGEKKSPDMSVVTGNVGEEDHGLIPFRKDFIDYMAMDLGERRHDSN